ncbi:hypothetical protein E2F43_18255 [Seongchinamella unica]|uniref:Uncharacterized protein n=1 Tax=Seongchinamella unica TaxID=2547392 RepID=A0A4R5LNE7_9GAMM|nr:hypothetical protein [Seongchinamella unica]TDG11654.1 hypothetical protein E2F43_18255 [Seongchinamella unica]
MKTPALREVSTRLEEAVALLPGEPAGPADLYDRYEEVAIAILDSEHGDFIPGELQEYLETLLYAKQLELGLIPFPDPAEA